MAIMACYLCVVLGLRQHKHLKGGELGIQSKTINWNCFT